MTRPAAVVYIEGTQGAAREEAAWAVRWLRRDFSVALARDWDGIERRIDESVRIALVLGSHVPEPWARTIRGLPSRSRMILAVPAEVRNEMQVYDGEGPVEGSESLGLQISDVAR